MKRIPLCGTAMFLLSVCIVARVQPQQQIQSTPPLTAQQQAARDATREQLRALLDDVGPRINVAFRQSTKVPYNFVGVLSQGLTNADSYEIVISVSIDQMLHFRVFPHYKGAYLNLDKATNGAGLMRQLLRFGDTNFFYWGADDGLDIFAGYNITLESGFPDAAVRVVLNSIPRLDQFVGEMKPSID